MNRNTLCHGDNLLAPFYSLFSEPDLLLCSSHMPLTIYTAGLTNKKQIALYESIANTASIVLQLAVLLFFIFKFEPAKKLLLTIF